MAPGKRREQNRQAKIAERSRRLGKPKAFKAHKKAEAERKRKERKKLKHTQNAQARRIVQLEAEVKKNKNGYLHNLKVKDQKDERARKNMHEHIKGLESKVSNWEHFWKKLPRDVRCAAIAASRGRYRANCPMRGFHKDPSYWDPNLSFWAAL